MFLFFQIQPELYIAPPVPAPQAEIEQPVPVPNVPITEPTVSTDSEKQVKKKKKEKVSNPGIIAIF